MFILTAGINNDLSGSSSVIVGEDSAVFGKNAPSSEEEEDEADRNEKGAAAFSSSWLPGSDSKYVYLFLLKMHTSLGIICKYWVGVVRLWLDYSLM